MTTFFPTQRFFDFSILYNPDFGETMSLRNSIRLGPSSLYKNRWKRLSYSSPDLYRFLYFNPTSITRLTLYRHRVWTPALIQYPTTPNSSWNVSTHWDRHVSHRVPIEKRYKNVKECKKVSITFGIVTLRTTINSLYMNLLQPFLSRYNYHQKRSSCSIIHLHSEMDKEL